MTRALQAASAPSTYVLCSSPQSGTYYPRRATPGRYAHPAEQARLASVSPARRASTTIDSDAIACDSPCQQDHLPASQRCVTVVACQRSAMRPAQVCTTSANRRSCLCRHPPPLRPLRCSGAPTTSAAVGIAMEALRTHRPAPRATAPPARPPTAAIPVPPRHRPLRRLSAQPDGSPDSLVSQHSDSPTPSRAQPVPPPTSRSRPLTCAPRSAASRTRSRRFRRWCACTPRLPGRGECGGKSSR